jgi:DnaJ-class molecular chaperone
MTRYFDYPRERERDTAPRCQRCEGTGRVPVDRPYTNLVRHGQVTCSSCQGTGYAGGREP